MRRGRNAFRGRFRRRDRVVRRHLPRPTRQRRAGAGIRDHRARSACGVRARRAHGADWCTRARRRAAGLPTGLGQRSRRPARASDRSGRRHRAAHRRQRRCSDVGGRQETVVGVAGDHPGTGRSWADRRTIDRGDAVITREDLLAASTPVEAKTAVRSWVSEVIPTAWRGAAEADGPSAVRSVRTPDEYRAWYPTLAAAGLVVPQWNPEYGGLGWDRQLARAAEQILTRYHLPRLNPLGLNLAAPALFSDGTEDQRLRFLPPIVRNEQVWCQLFSEPGAGSDLASLATRAVRDGYGWRITGQKVWTTWAHLADMAVLLARTDPEVAKRNGITYFLIDLHQPGVEVKPLRHIGGEVDFNEVFLDGAFVPDDQRVGEVNAGWKV